MGNISAWRFFFLAEGLFFTGLSLGILGSTTVVKSRQAAYVLVAVGLLSLLLGFILWALQAQKERKLRGQTLRTVLRPLELKKVFDSLLQSSNHIPLLKGRNFLSDARLLLHDYNYELAADKQLVIHHCAGRPLEIKVGDKSCRLDENSVLRLPALPSLRNIEICPIDVGLGDDDEFTTDTRAPQILMHTIDDSYQG